MHAARLQTAICLQLAALATYLCTTFGKLYGGGTANSLFDLL